MGEQNNLYFIAIIPPPEICDEINLIKEDFAIRFKSKHALKVVPHITLKSPFRFAASSHTQVLKWFQQMQLSVNPFQQELKNFGCFTSKRTPVIFITPTSNQLLLLLQKQVFTHFHNAFPQFSVTNAELHYKPHITVAYRDLLPAQFHKAWQEYASKEFSANFQVHRFHLLQHDKKRWNSISEFALL